MSRIWRHIKDGFFGVKRHFALAFSSISSVTVTLTMVSVFLLLNANVQEISKNIEGSVQIHIQISDEVDTKEGIAALEASVKALPYVASVQFSSKDDELEAFINMNDSDEAEARYGSFRGEKNPMLNALLVNVDEGDHLKETAAAVRELDGVFHAAYGGDGTMNLVEMMTKVRSFGLVIVVALTAVAVFLISNTIRASIHSRRREIGIMRQVGATNWYIRWPFVIEGIIIGLLGSVLPIVLTVYGYQYIFNTSGGFLISDMFTLVGTFPLVNTVSLVLGGLGMAVGALGSVFSVGKYLRWTR